MEHVASLRSRRLNHRLKSTFALENVIHVHGHPRHKLGQILTGLVRQLPNALIRSREREFLEVRLGAALNNLALGVPSLRDPSPRDLASLRAVIAHQQNSAQRVRELVSDLAHEVRVHLDFARLFVEHRQANLLPRRLAPLLPLLGRANVDDDETASDGVFDVRDRALRLGERFVHVRGRARDVSRGASRVRARLGRLEGGRARDGARAERGDGRHGASYGLGNWSGAESGAGDVDASRKGRRDVDVSTWDARTFRWRLKF